MRDRPAIDPSEFSARRGSADGSLAGRERATSTRAYASEKEDEQGNRDALAQGGGRLRAARARRGDARHARAWMARDRRRHRPAGIGIRLGTARPRTDRTSRDELG